MRYPPLYFQPGVWEPMNGQLAEGVHAGEIDAFACWLATQRLPIPPSIGAVMNNQAYGELLQVPQYSQHVGFAIFASGSGDLDITCDMDAYGSRVYIDTPGTTRNSATWYFVNTPLASVTDSTRQRALNVTDSTRPAIAELIYTVPSGVYVWEIVPFILPRSFGAELPGAVSAEGGGGGGGVSYYADSVPVVYYDMSDGSGDTVSDVSSAGNNLDGTKASTQTGQPLWDTSTKVRGAYSLQFDHNDSDAVLVSDNAALDFSTDDAFSISCWIKRVGTADSGNVVGMVTKMAQSSSSDSPFEGYALWFNDSQQRRPSFLLYKNVTGLQQLRVQASSLAFADTDTDWHHILVTYNGNSNLDGVTMYIDGSSVTTSLESADTLPPGTDITTATDLCLGGFINSTSNNSRIYSFAGHMDEVAIWNKELSSAEVTAVYNNGSGVDLTNGIPSS